MNTKCDNCGCEFEECICPRVAAFFAENGHLMETENGKRRDQQERPKFFYVQGLSPLAKSH